MLLSIPSYDQQNVFVIPVDIIREEETVLEKYTLKHLKIGYINESRTIII